MTWDLDKLNMTVRRPTGMEGRTLGGRGGFRYHAVDEAT
jgi:hypothetical protein